MDFYHDLVTQKSWQELTRLVKQVSFTLIGGWAIYLYTKQLKSKDIDIIVDFDALSALKKQYDVRKNDRLHKYEANKGEVQIDIYLPHYSELGIPLEMIIDKAQIREGFRVLDPNFLFLLKLYTLKERGRTPKGRKDFLDLISLVLAEVTDLPKINTLIHTFHLEESNQVFKEFLSEHNQISELSLNAHRYSRLKQNALNSLIQI